MKSKIKLSLCLVAMLSTCSVYAQSNYKLEKVSVSESQTPRTLSQNEAFSAPETSKLTIDTLSEEEIKIANPIQNDAKLSLYSRNLLDENYMTIFGFEDQGRVIGVSYEFKF